MKRVILCLTIGLALLTTSCRKQNMVETDADQQAPQEQLTSGSLLEIAKPCLGKPQPYCICPDVYQPVCGCNGVTYGNSCEAACAGVLRYKPGPCGCLGTPAPRPCPDVYMPVCGCNGVTYGNSCEAEVAGVLIYTQGGCNGEQKISIGGIRGS
jgi:hypothetical protein